jgi:hypothetical protein
MPTKASKLELFNFGRQLGQMDVILGVVVQKLSSQEELCLKAKELEPKLEMLKLMFRAKCLKRTANFDNEIGQLKQLDEDLNQILEEMKAADIYFYDE